MPRVPGVPVTRKHVAEYQPLRTSGGVVPVCATCGFPQYMPNIDHESEDDMPKTTTYRFTVKVPNRSMWLAGLFDMLRYDRAVVVDSHRDAESDVWVLTLQSERLTTARWESFGIFIAPGTISFKS